MKIKAKNVGLFTATILIAIVVLATFLQFAHASAASVQAVNTAALKNSPRAVEADQPGEGAWIVSVNISDTSLNIVNTATDMVYGPFLEGQLGPIHGQTLDVVVLPDRPMALISNFGASEVHVVDLSNPISPSWVISISTPMFAEDMDLTADGRFAILNDGSFSPYVAVIDTLNMTVAYTMNLNTVLSPTTAYVNGVEVAPDGTVVMVDYFQGKIHTLLIDETGYITYANSYTDSIPGQPITTSLMRPVNLGIAPDGETILLCHAATDTVSVYRILEPGVLTFTGVVTGVAGEVYSGTSASVQSVDFNEAGDRAYLNINGVFYLTNTHPSNDRLSILNIDGPGMASLNTTWAASLTRFTNSQLFGVDTIAVTGGKAYLGHPTGSYYTGTNDLAVVDLTSFSVYSLTVGDAPGDVPVGVDVLPIRLGMSKQVSDETAYPGQTVTFTVVLDNLGPQVTQLTISDVLPAGLNFIGPVTLDPPGAGVVGLAPPTLVQSMTIATGQQITISFPVSISWDAAIGDILNTVWAASPEMTSPAMAEQAVTVEWYITYLPMIVRH